MAEGDPHWVCFQDHLSYVSELLQWEVKTADIPRLKAKVLDTHKQLRSLYGSAVVKPKLHFIEHCDLYIERYVWSCIPHEHVYMC